MDERAGWTWADVEEHELHLQRVELRPLEQLRDASRRARVWLSASLLFYPDVVITYREEV